MKKLRVPRPWYRPSRGLWYVTLDGHQHNLGPDRDDALERYKALVSQPRTRVVAGASLVLLVDEFLEWTEKHRSPDTYVWYKSRLEFFCRQYPHLATTELKPFHVQKWIDSFEVSSGTKRNYCRSIQRAMRWAEQQGYIDRSPIAHMEKPRAGKREIVVSLEEFEQILGQVRDEEFKDLLVVTWESGCRPQESLRVEARHVDLANARWFFPASESKTDVPRIVYLSDKALDMMRRLIRRYPQGKLFRNTDGVPWTTDAVNCRFTALKQKLGKRYCLYHLRHTWMNRLLLSGVDGLTVAVLAGHCDPSTLAKTYQHLSQSPDNLRSSLKRA